MVELTLRIDEHYCHKGTKYLNTKTYNMHVIIYIKYSIFYICIHIHLSIFLATYISLPEFSNCKTKFL